MQTYLFETPWWVFIGFAIVAIGLVVSSNRRQEKKLLLAAGVVALLGVGLFLMSYFVETPRETVRRRAKELVNAVVEKKSEPLQAILSTQATLGRWRKADIVAGAKLYADNFGLTGASITQLEVDQPGPSSITSQITLFSSHDAKGGLGTVNSTWRMDWEREGDAWMLREITPVKVLNFEKGYLLERFFNR